ncbi:antA/AntB antirepressor family protein [Acinetobacter baumannii]|uniref:antA/AntB antirepressor family protein n=1 Tax=Acinetobacter baumannii TaxID=470 RepID=UPI00387E7669
MLKVWSSPKQGSSNSRQQKQTDYFLTLDMGKQLSMVENNEKGHEARRYFLRCEKLAFESHERKFMGRCNWNTKSNFTLNKRIHCRKLLMLR